MRLTEEAEAVWLRGKIVESLLATEWRQDDFGKLMYHDSYGQTTDHGWEIDHIKQVQYDGSDNLDNKRPLQWEANRKR